MSAAMGLIGLLGLAAPLQFVDEDAAAFQQRRTKYYRRWLGVQAPSFEFQEWPQTPVRSIELYRGQRILLYSFDAGNFVNGPDPEVFPENLRMLNRARQGLSDDDAVVIGFTGGLFLFADIPGMTWPDDVVEARRLADFPIARPPASRQSPEPYRLLLRPGGIVIDRKGIIQGIYTTQMTEMQIREALTGRDWDRPVRPAPVDNPWPQGRPKPLVQVTRLWSVSLAGVIGMTFGDWDLDGTADLILVTADHLVVLTASGTEKTRVALGAIDGRRLQVDYGRIEEGAPVVLLRHGGWPRSVPVYDAEGHLRWRFPRENLGGIDSAAWVDIDGDGRSEMVVGFNGRAGLHVVSSEGQSLWSNYEIKICWHVAGFDAADGRPGLVLGSDTEGHIRIYDAGGTEIQRIRPRIGRAYRFVAADVNDHDQRQILFIREEQIGEYHYATAVDLDGRILWEFPIRAFDMPLVACPMGAADLTGDGIREWIFPSSPTQISVVDATGALLADIPVEHEPLLACLPRPTAPSAVVLYDDDRLTAWTLTAPQ